MGRPRILDKRIMLKIAKKIGKSNIVTVNSMVSRKASKLGISPEAALIALAKEYGIGTATFQKSLDVNKQAEVRDALLTAFVPNVGKTSLKGSGNKIDKRTLLKSAIEYLIQDDELIKRCKDILLASSNFDRPINQATLVLEDRIRNKAKPSKKLVGVKLVRYAFNEDLSKTLLKVAGGDQEDQRGFTQILLGIVPAFRNKTHHRLIDSFTREDAMKVCGFIDVLLRVVDNSTN